MKPTRFDHIGKLFAARKLSRRQALGVAGSTAIAAGLATGMTSASAQDATPVATPGNGMDEKIAYLFVQSYQSGSIAPTEGADGRYTVTLEQGLGQTIYFADRPSRDVGASPTAAFLAGLGFPEDNPPNAAILVETAPGETEIAVVELFNPTYDEATHTATYEVAPLEDWQDSLALGLSEAPADLATLAPTFGAAHLLIDDCPNDSIDCISFADGSLLGSYSNQGFCYNFAVCMPCEPYGHTQPDGCSTATYWNQVCGAQIAACATPGCYSMWPSRIFTCSPTS